MLVTLAMLPQLDPPSYARHGSTTELAAPATESSTVGVDHHGAVRVINATTQRLDVSTSQHDSASLAEPR